MDLLNGTSIHSKNFVSNNTQYNSAFQILTFDASNKQVENEFTQTLIVQEQVYNLIGSSLPTNEQTQIHQINFISNVGQETRKMC